MKNFLLIVFLSIICQFSFSQCQVKTTTKEDGNVLKYLNPMPVVRQADYEIGLSVYKNISSNITMLNVSVLFKGKEVRELEGDAIIHTSGERGISLKPVVFDLVEMNGKDVAIGLYEIEPILLSYFENNYLKNIFVKVGGDLVGASVSENKWIIRDNLNCLN